MRKITLILLCICASIVCAHAETLLLRTGARVEGTIVFQNEEVVIIRNAEGARFQYPRADISEVIEDSAAQAQESEEASDEEPEIKTSKKASILLEVGGGVAVLPNDKAGGAVSVDLLVGSHHIGNKHLFIGGGFGYHGLFLGSTTLNFLPIQVALRMPFMETKHAPVFGLALGYGIALSKDYLGGMYAGVDFGYRCQLNPRTAIGIVAYAQFQQAYLPVTTTITAEDGTSTDYTHKAGRYPVSTGIKLALYF